MADNNDRESIRDDENDRHDEKKALRKQKKKAKNAIATKAKEELNYFETIDSNLSKDIKDQLKIERITDSKALSSVFDALSSAVLSDAPIVFGNIGSNNSVNDNDKEGTIEFNREYAPLLYEAYKMCLSPNKMNSRGEASYKKFYDCISFDVEKSLKYLDRTQCERSIGILGHYATILRQRGDFSLCSKVLDVDKRILDRYFELCKLDDGSDEVEKAKLLSCLEGLKYKYLLIKFNLLKDSGEAYNFLVYDMHFMLKFEARKFLSGDYYIDEDEDDKRKNKSLPRESCECLWGYREVVVFPNLNKEEFFKHVISLYGPNSSRDHIETEMKKWASKKAVENVVKSLTDEQVFDFLKLWILSFYEWELSGRFPLEGINYEVVSKHKFYKKYIHELSKLNFCHNNSCGKLARMYCPCKFAKYCDKTCQVAHRREHKKVCTFKKEA